VWIAPYFCPPTYAVLLMTCDFRVQCGRCGSPDERSSCQVIWSVFTCLYGLAAFGIVIQNFCSSGERPSLLQRVLMLWACACSLRVLGGVILAAHLDKRIHPIILEILWHSVWLCGCYALTYFVAALLNVLANMKKLKISGIPVQKIATISNIFWGLVFLVFSIVNGLSSSWPSPEIQWFAWTACALYLCAGAWYSLRKFQTIQNKAKSRRARRMSLESRTTKLSKLLPILNIFTNAVIIGLVLYTAFLPVIGILRLLNKTSLLVETILTVMAQSGMLCMGFGMQYGVYSMKSYEMTSDTNSDSSGRAKSSNKSWQRDVKVTKSRLPNNRCNSNISLQSVHKETPERPTLDHHDRDPNNESCDSTRAANILATSSDDVNASNHKNLIQNI